MTAPLHTLVVTTAQRPDLVGIVADWVWRAFWQTQGYSFEQVHALVARCDAVVGPPQCFVLLVEDRPVATASLVVSDLDSRPDLTPWLAGVYTCPEARGRGYATRLVGVVEAAARAADRDELWLYTLTAENLYRKVGWLPVERFQHIDGPAVLMRKSLQGLSRTADA